VRPAIVWDLLVQLFIRQSTGHNATLTTIDFNDLTVYIFST
jgi:hypothetical protein